MAESLRSAAVRAASYRIRNCWRSLRKARVSASPGQFGGLRSQTGMRTFLDKLGMLVISQLFALGMAHESGVGEALYRMTLRLT